MLAELLAKPSIKTLLIFLSGLLLFSLLAFALSAIFVPLLFSFVIYALLQPYSNRLSRLGLPEIWTNMIPLSLLILILVLGITYIIPEITRQFMQLQQQLPVISQSFKQLIHNIEQLLANHLHYQLKLGELISFDLATLQTWIKPVLVNLSQKLLGLSVILLLIPIFSFFLLKDFKKFRNRLLGFLPNRYFELGWLIYYRVSRQLQSYLGGIMLQSMIMAIVSALGFYLLGIQSAMLLGFLTGLLNLIPYIGPLLAMIGPILVALAQYPGDLQMILLAISVIGVAQLIDNLVVIPWLIADSVNLHPMTVICGVIIFGGLFDMIGMVVAIPAIATAKIIIVELYKGMLGFSKPV